MKKYTVSRDFFGFYFTESENFHSRIRNERKVRRLSDFISFDEIVEWMERNGFCKKDEIEIVR